MIRSIVAALAAFALVSFAVKADEKKTEEKPAATKTEKKAEGAKAEKKAEAPKADAAKAAAPATK